AAATHVSALAFLASSHDLLITDDSDDSIRRIADTGNTAATSWTVRTAGASLDSVLASRDGKLVFAGSSRHSFVATLDSQGGNITYVNCACQPSEIRPLSAPSVYQVSEAHNGVLWIFDNSTSAPRLLFVPVPPGGEAANAHQGQPGHKRSQ